MYKSEEVERSRRYQVDRIMTMYPFIEWPTAFSMTDAEFGNQVATYRTMECWHWMSKHFGSGLQN